MEYLKNGCAILTGASGGLGRELTALLIEKYSCNVIGIGRNEEKLSALKNRYGERFSYYIFDTSEKENWVNFSESLRKSGVKANILINNAGILPNFEKFEINGSQMLSDVMKINFYSCVYAVEQILPVLRESGKTPVIVNVSSSAALFSLAGISGYSASKAAIKGFTESIALELRAEALVSLVMPGFCKTEIFRNQKHTGNMNIVDKISSDPQKISRRVLRLVNAGKKRIIIGWDALLMNFFTKLFPTFSLRVYTSVMKKSGLELFKDIF